MTHCTDLYSFVFIGVNLLEPGRPHLEIVREAFDQERGHEVGAGDDRAVREECERVYRHCVVDPNGPNW